MQAQSLVLFMGVLACSPAPAQAAKAKVKHKSPPSACQRLAGYDRAPDASVKLVWRRVDSRVWSGSELVGCVLPRGKVHVLGTSTDMTPDDRDRHDVMLMATGGATVVFDFSSASQYATFDRTQVFDLRTDHGYLISSRCLGLACGGGPQGGVVRLAFPDRHGGVIAVLENDPAAPDGVAIVRFDPRRGTREILDAGSYDDIMVSPDNQPSGSVVWTHGGQPRSAPLYVPPA